MRKAIMIVIFMLLPCLALATEEYDFAKDFVEGLSLRKNIEDKIKLADSQQYKNELEKNVDNIKLIYLANKEIEQAIMLLSKYTTSKNPLIKETSETTISLYKKFIEINNHSIRFCEELDSPDAIKNPEKVHIGKKMSELASINADKEEVSRSLMYCSVMLTHALTRMPAKKDEVITRMAITLSEKNNLIKEIDTIFGDKAKSIKAGASYLDSSGAALRQYLTGQLKSSNEK